MGVMDGVDGVDVGNGMSVLVAGSVSMGVETIVDDGTLTGCVGGTFDAEAHPVMTIKAIPISSLPFILISLHFIERQHVYFTPDLRANHFTLQSFQ